MASRGARIRDLALAIFNQNSEHNVLEEALLHDIVIQPPLLQDSALTACSADLAKCNQQTIVPETEIVMKEQVFFNEVQENNIYFDVLLGSEIFQETKCNQETEKCDNSLPLNRIKLVEYSDSDECSDAVENEFMNNRNRC